MSRESIQEMAVIRIESSSKETINAERMPGVKYFGTMGRDAEVRDEDSMFVLFTGCLEGYVVRSVQRRGQCGPSCFRFVLRARGRIEKTARVTLTETWADVMKTEVNTPMQQLSLSSHRRTSRE